jgi:hypothetical protein
VGFAEQRGQHGDHQQHQQPRHVRCQRSGERDEGNEVLDRRQDQAEQGDAADRLPPRPLEAVVQLRVLELLQVKRGGVAHEVHAGAVGEEVA